MTTHPPRLTHPTGKLFLPQNPKAPNHLRVSFLSRQISHSHKFARFSPPSTPPPPQPQSPSPTIPNLPTPTSASYFLKPSYPKSPPQFKPLPLIATSLHLLPRPAPKIPRAATSLLQYELQVRLYSTYSRNMSRLPVDLDFDLRIAPKANRLLK